jgi:YidC/Oxa1 family membrane protein insertase
MELWTGFVDLIYKTLFGLSMIFGGNMGLAIGALSLGFRLVLLPLTLRLAYRALRTQAALKKVESELSSIRTRYKSDPAKMWEETAKVHQREGIRLVDGRSLISVAVQVPLFLALFSAVRRGLSSSGRFLWVKDLMKSDPIMAVICAALTGLSTFLGSNAPEQQRTASVLLPATLTLFFLWRMSAGVTIYTLGSGLVGLLQSLLIRRQMKRAAA